jgi:hypothetical protein
VKKATSQIVFLLAATIVFSGCTNGSGPQDGQTKAPEQKKSTTKNQDVDTEPANESSARNGSSQNTKEGQKPGVSSADSASPRTTNTSTGRFKEDPRFKKQVSQGSSSSQSGNQSNQTGSAPVAAPTPAPDVTSSGSSTKGSTIRVELVPSNAAESLSAPGSTATREILQATQEEIPAQPEIIKSPAAVRMPLDVTLIYGDERSKMSRAANSVVEAMIKKAANLEGAQAANVMGDFEYVDTIPAKKLAVSYTTVDMLIDSSACYINGRGGCVVMEKLTVNGVSTVRLYNVGSIELWATKTVVMARMNLAPSQEAERILNGHKDGIYIFSPAASERDVVHPRQTVDLDASKPVVETPAPVPSQPQDGAGQSVTRKDGVMVAATPEEIAKFEAEVKEIEKITALNPKNPAVPAYATQCWVKGQISLVRRFFLVDLTSQIRRRHTDGTKKQLPIKSGKGQLFCKLSDGTRQMPKIVINEYQKGIRLGLALGKIDQKIFATGIGTVGGAIDLLKMKKFYYPVSADAQIAPIAGLSLAPLVLSCKEDMSVLAFMIGYLPEQNKFGINASVTIGGKYEIAIDPDET